MEHGSSGTVETKSGTVSRWVPSLTLVFNARRKDTGKEQLLYAVVTKYTESNGELIDMFEPGCIYRFGTVTVDVAKICWRELNRFHPEVRAVPRYPEQAYRYVGSSGANRLLHKPIKYKL